MARYTRHWLSVNCVILTVFVLDLNKARCAEISVKNAVESISIEELVPVRIKGNFVTEVFDARKKCRIRPFNCEFDEKCNEKTFVLCFQVNKCYPNLDICSVVNVARTLTTFALKLFSLCQ